MYEWLGWGGRSGMMDEEGIGWFNYGERGKCVCVRKQRMQRG